MLGNRRIAIIVTAAGLLGVASLVVYAAFHRLLAITTLSIELSADGQPIAPGEMPNVLCDGNPFVSGDKVKPGTVIVATRSDVLQDCSWKMRVEAGKSNHVQLDLKYRTGSIEIITDPPGARVVQAGRSLGTTPMRFESVRVGPHQYWLSLSGWPDSLVRGDVQDGETLDLFCRFPHGRLSVGSVPPGAAIKRGGVVVGRTPVVLDNTPAGEIDLVLSLAGWDDFVFKDGLEDGKEIKFSHRFPHGEVSITSSPAGAVVKQGDIVLGRTPLVLGAVPAGNVAYALEMKDYLRAAVDGRVEDRGQLHLTARLISFDEDLRIRDEKRKETELLAEKEREEMRRAEQEALERKRLEEQAEAERRYRERVNSSPLGMFHGVWHADPNENIHLIIDAERSLVTLVMGRANVRRRLKLKAVNDNGFIADQVDEEMHYWQVTGVMDQRDRRALRIKLYQEDRSNARYPGIFSRAATDVYTMTKEAR